MTAKRDHRSQLPARTGKRRMKRDCTCPNVRHEHGTKLAYNTDRCRCAECREAIIEHQRAYRRRAAQAVWTGKVLSVPPHGTVRRLQALAAVGWTWREIGAHLGLTAQAVSDLVLNRTHNIMPRTASTVADAYRQMSDTPPTGWVNDRMRRHAASRGWHPPIAWDDDIDDPNAKPYASAPVDIDEIAVEQACNGRRVHLTRAERLAAVARLTGRGYSEKQISELLGYPARTVARDKAAIRGQDAA